MIKMAEQKENKFARRQFLARVGKAGASIAAAGIAAKLLYDDKGPRTSVKPEELVTLPDFSAATKPGQIMSVVKGPDRVNGVNKAIDLLGGIERFVKEGDVVVIKPNVAFATSPILGATSNPELIAEVVKLCYSRGKAKKVYVTDNPINDPASCFMLSGVGKWTERSGAEVILPKESSFKLTNLEGGRLIKNWPIFFAPFEKCDKVIGIAPVKDHDRSGASMTIKNWYGLLGGRRNIFHQDINTIIAELAMMVKPTLVILDGTYTMMTNGPTGGSMADLKKTDTIIASCDMVAADAYGCGLLGLKPEQLPYLAKAQKAGAGTVDYMKLKPKIADTV